jgi:hypothetical protein
MALIIIVIAALLLVVLLAFVMGIPHRLRSRPAASPGQHRMWRDWLDPAKRRQRPPGDPEPPPGPPWPG